MTRVQWGPVVAGAFLAVAVGVVLSLFGTAFGLGNLRVFSGIWLILTPLVASLIGAAAAVAMAGRPNAYGTGIMVWAVSLAAWALFLAPGVLGGATNAAAQQAAQQANQANQATQQMSMGATSAGLAGLATILGLIGAVIGSAIGAMMADRRAATRRPAETYREERVFEPGHPEARPQEPLHH